MITGEVLRQLLRRTVVKFTNLTNTAFRLKYMPRQWKVAEVITIQKPEKSPHEALCYRLILLLPANFSMTIFKLFEKLLLKSFTPITKRKNLIPNHKLRFRIKHSTVNQNAQDN